MITGKRKGTPRSHVRRQVLTIPVKRTVNVAMIRVLTPARLKRLRYLPSLPPRFRDRYAAVTGAWPSFDREVPADLRTTPGIRRDEAAEDEAFAKEPVWSFHHNHGTSVVWALGLLWQSMLPVGPRLMRAIARAQATATRGRAPAASTEESVRGGSADSTRHLDPVRLTRDLKELSARIGMSTVGISTLDQRYLFADSAGEPVGEYVIVCVLEQNWPVTQIGPGPVTEQAALSTNAELMELASEIAEALQALGFRARAHTTEGSGIIHHYAIQAGLGQLGYNGQLLTPHAGSRCRITMITTDAPLVADVPKDFGVPAICAECKACVRRCPSGAIPARPSMYRGVEKSKLNLERCFPVVSQVHGCSVCMKVCPVQRYGLGAVYDHFENTGQILGRDSNELEGYNWPLDGQHYGPGTRPRLAPSFFDVPGFGRFAAETDHGPAVDNPLM